MATMHSPATGSRPRRSKPAMGHPMVFALLLAVAAAGVLLLLVAGPSIALPLAIGCASALIALVVLTWVVAGPRL